MINLVYLLGRGSKWENNELRYSLRSVERYGKNVGDIIIVGEELPDWVSKDNERIKLLYSKDPYEKKWDNAWYKINQVCKKYDRFILMNDDFFLVKEVDFDTLPVYYNGELQSLIDKYTKTSSYVGMLTRTVDVLSKIKPGATQYNFALHVPLIVESKKIEKFMKSVDGHATGLSFRSIYGNLAVKIEDCIQLPDFKINSTISKNVFNQVILNRTYFSIGDKFLATTSGGKQILEDLYPTPSTFENIT